METRINIATNSGYIFVNGRLTAYEFKSAKVNFGNGEVEYTCMLGGEEVRMALASCPEVFKNEEDYLHGKAIKAHELTWSEAIRKAFGFDLWDKTKMVDNSGVCKGFTIVNNEVVECDMPVSDYVTDGFNCQHKDKGAFYQHREQAILYCDIIKVEADGTKVVCPSPATRVALDEEQMLALKGLELAYKRVSELGIVLCVDNSDDRMYAYSRRDEKERTWDCCHESINDYGYAINDLMTEVDVDAVTWCMDDTTLYVKFK